MPNTTAPDLDREALEKLLVAAKMLQQNSEGCAVNHHGIDYEQFGLPGWLKDTAADIARAQASISALPRASGVPEAEAAARIESAFIDGWNAVFSQYSDVDTAFAAFRWARTDRAAPPPVAAPSGEAEPVAWITKSGLRNWQRGVEAEPHILLRSGNDLRVPLYLTPPSPIASEPKDAGSGEGQPIKVNNLGLIKAVTAYDQYWENHDDASEAVRCAIEAYLAFTRTAPSGAKP